MVARTYLIEQIQDLEKDLVAMGTQVEVSLTLAIDALTQAKPGVIDDVFRQDDKVNALRHQIEKTTVMLMATQQPMAVDLRRLISILTMSADLERMGDQAKNIAKAIPFIQRQARLPLLHELKKMAQFSTSMLQDSLIAYQDNDLDLARQVAEIDDEVDRLFASIYTQMMAQIKQRRDGGDIQVGFEFLRVAQSLERFADLATNLAERVIYKVTSKFTEINVDQAPQAR